MEFDGDGRMTVYIKVILTCELCGGTGRHNNPDFERCAMYDIDNLLYFNCDRGICKSCNFRTDCLKGEICECPQCNGRGKLEYDSIGWDIEIVKEELDEICKR